MDAKLKLPMPPSHLEILTNEEMREADRLTVAGGIPGATLMEAAGRAVTDVILERWGPEDIDGPVLVVCGPGNNGGDGFVIARLLAGAGITVALRVLGPIEKLTGDAALMASRWTGNTLPLSAEENIDDCPIVVDALFGSGLARPLDGDVAGLVEKINRSGSAVVAVDIPSGVNGNSGAVSGSAIRADVTVTFFRKKPGHILQPGADLTGELIVCDIGIGSEVLARIDGKTWENGPALWLSDFPWPARTAHKYSRGHAIVVSGNASATGAARLGAYAALRSGAGLVTLAAPSDAVDVIASQVSAVMVREIADVQAWQDWLADERISAALIGPGNGISARTRDFVIAARGMAKDLVLDADALTAFEGDPDQLFQLLDQRCVLTPHEGEYRRLFKDFADGLKIERVKRAAVAAGAVLLLKGPETVIACPDGRCVVSVNGSPWLATAGSGDVLAGIIVGLVAQGMPSFEAACAGAWIHGASGNLIGPGLIAEDLVKGIPVCLSELFDLAGRKFSS